MAITENELRSLESDSMKEHEPPKPRTAYVDTDLTDPLALQSLYGQASEESDWNRVPIYQQQMDQ